MSDTYACHTLYDRNTLWILAQHSINIVLFFLAFFYLDTLKHGLKDALDKLAHPLDSPWVANEILGSCQSLGKSFYCCSSLSFMAKSGVNVETFFVRAHL